MTAALQRLRKRSEFLAVAATNRRSTTPGLVLQVRRRADGEASPECAPALRVGFTATKKIGNAVHRNRARRRLRAAVHEVLGNAGVMNADIVVVARQGTLQRGFTELRADLETALRRLEVLA